MMNIREAKTEIKNALLAYHRKDPEGNYRYPALRQRPILLMGPPGIGENSHYGAGGPGMRGGSGSLHHHSPHQAGARWGCPES